MFRSGWRVLPFDFNQFEALYDLRMVLETTAAQRLCDSACKRNSNLLGALAAIWLLSPAQRSSDSMQVAQWDEAFRFTLVAAAGNVEIARVHRDVTERIRMFRRLDFTKQPRIDATYWEHTAKSLRPYSASAETKPRCCCAPTSRPARPRCAKSRCTRCTWRARWAAGRANAHSAWSVLWLLPVFRQRFPSLFRWSVHGCEQHASHYPSDKAG